jgi:RND family efflux transporter MFP subunit
MTRKQKVILQIVIGIALIALGTGGFVALKASKPEIKKRRPPVAVPMVRTMGVKTEPQAVIIRGEGTVRPLREINLVPQVGGKVVDVSPALVDGGVFKKGDTLLRIDPVDYQLALTLAKAKVKDAESRVQLAKEEAAAAQEEWQLLFNDDSKDNKKPPPLVAKEPQLAAAQAQLEADQADLRKAMLNLERTVLTAPFDGRVGEESVDVGQYVIPGQTLGSLYSIEAAEIVLPLEDEDLFWFDVPGFTMDKGPGSAAVIRARVAGQQLSWSGRVVRTEGKLDERTRMIDVVIRVEKPYARKPPLAVGLFVKVDIQGKTLPKVALIPRAALRQGDVVWVVDEDNRLHFRRVEVSRIQGDEAVVRGGLEDGEKVVTTPLKAVTDGMVVRTVRQQ